MHTGSWGAGKAQGVQNQLLSLRRSEGAGAAEAAEKQGLGSGSQRKFWADSVWGEKTEVPAAQICTCDLSRPFPLKKCKDFRYWKIQGTASPLPPGGGGVLAAHLCAPWAPAVPSWTPAPRWLCASPPRPCCALGAPEAVVHSRGYLGSRSSPPQTTASGFPTHLPPPSPRLRP